MKRITFAGMAALALSLIMILGCDGATASGDPALAGNITISPASGVTTGTQLTAVYSGSETGIGYQWKKGGANVGTNSSTYTPAEAGSYTVTVSAPGYQSKTSAAVTVTGLQTLSGTITINPAGPVTAATRLTAAYSGSEYGLTYQWKKDGTNVATGGTVRTYTPTEEGSYTITVSAPGYQSKTSAAVTVSGYKQLTGSIHIKAPPLPTVEVELTAVYSGSETDRSYQWKKDGTIVGNYPTYWAEEKGNYTVTVSAPGYQSKTSAALWVGPKPD